jgi:hypothetical protein
MNRLQTESRKDFGEYRATRMELQEVQDRVIELQEPQPTNDAYIEAMASINREITLHNLSIDMTRCNLHYALEFLQVVSEETELNLLEIYRKKEANEHKNIMESTKKLEAANLRKLQLDQPTADAIEREKVLTVEVETLKLKLEENRKFIHQLKGSSHQTLILRPSRFPIEGAEVEEDLVFHWMPCAFCKSPFPAKNVIIAPICAFTTLGALSRKIGHLTRVPRETTRRNLVRHGKGAMGSSIFKVML